VAVTLLTLLVGMFSLTGRNTWKGAGKDIERGAKGYRARTNPCVA